MTATTTYRRKSAAQLEKLGLRLVTISAEQLRELLPADGSPLSIWVGFGHVRGREMFSTQLHRRCEGGVEVGYMIGDFFMVALIHPLGRGRTIRTALNPRP